MKTVPVLLALMLAPGVAASTRAQHTHDAPAPVPTAPAVAPAPGTASPAPAPGTASPAPAPGLYPLPGAVPAQPAAPAIPPAPMAGRTHTQPNLQQPFPSPVMDDHPYTFLLFDVLEYRPNGRDSDFRWDIESWRGGDYRRFWIKSEGERNTAFKAEYDIDLQLLYGRLVTAYTEHLYGLRIEAHKYRGADIARPLLVLGLESLAPYEIETEASLFVDHRGNVSGSFKATRDLLFTQRLILQTRFETNAALQEVERFSTGPGINNVELGFRLRYEMRREFAPYIGVSFERSFGRTATLVRQDGGDPSQQRFVAGVRAWF